VVHLVPARVFGALNPHFPGGHVLNGAARLLDHGHFSSPGTKFTAPLQFVKDGL
jgi:hypothetical protein